MYVGIQKSSIKMVVMIISAGWEFRGFIFPFLKNMHCFSNEKGIFSFEKRYKSQNHKYP